MAKAIKVNDSYKIVLELTSEEAKVLYAILYRVGGDPFKSPRVYSQYILEELKKYFRTTDSPHKDIGTIYFKDNTTLNDFVEDK